MTKCDYFDICNQADPDDNLCLETFKYCSIYNAKKKIDCEDTVLGIGAIQLEDIAGIMEDIKIKK